MPLQALLAFVYLNQQLQASQAKPTDPRTERLSSIVSALYDIATGRSSLDEVLEYVVEAARAGTGASASVIALRDKDQFACCARSGTNAPEMGSRLNSHTGLSGECIRTGAIVKCDETWTDPRVNAIACRQLHVRSMIGVPIHHQRKVAGILEVLSERPGAFGDEQTITLQLLSSLVTHALQNEESMADASAAKERVLQQLGLLEQQTPEGLESIAGALHQAGGGVSHEATSDQQTLIQLSDMPTGLCPVPQCEPVLAPAITPDVGSAADTFLATVDSGREHESGPFRILAISAGVLLAIVLCGAAFVRHTRPSQPKQPAPRTSTPTPAPLSQMPATGAAQLSAVDIQSQPESTTIRLKLGRKVQFSSDRLSNPERVFFDLADTDLAATLNAEASARVAVHDARVAQVRLAQAPNHTTRVVLDLKCQCEYSALMAENVPSDLSIVIRPAAANAAISQPAPAPAPTPQSATTASAPLKPALPINAEPMTSRPAPLPTRMVVVLDAGHGGPDLGTVGPNGLQEKDLALDLALRLGRLLKQNLGAEVIYTRSDDQFVSLEARSAMANQAHADLVLSIHANSSSNPSARGVETYYFPADQAAMASSTVRATEASTRRLAAFIQRNLHGALRREDARVRDRGVKQAHFIVLTNAEIPAVLTEVAFLSSPSDERKLLFAPARDTIAAALYRGIAEFFRNNALRARPNLNSIAAHANEADAPLRGSAPAAAQ